jgi:RNA polymerase sigma factor (sigma-70 family)
LEDRGERSQTMSSGPASDWSNTKLVTACLAGDERAWVVLVDRYKNLIYSIPLRYGTTPQDAADIFQTVCLDLFNELPRLRDADALQSWLIRVTTHKCYHWKRKKSSQEEDLDDDSADTISATDLIPAELLAEVEQEQLVQEAVSQLPPRCKEMIELLFFEHPPMPYTEVARRLQLAKGSIGFIRGRCLKRLKKVLEEKGF